MLVIVLLVALMKTGNGKVDLQIVEHVLEKNDSVSWKLQCQKTEIDFLKSEMTSLKQELTSVKAEMNQVKKDLKADPRSLKAYQVKAKAHPTVIGNEAILRFDTVTLNAGGSYHASSGIFEAPVSGTYLFWANAMSYDSGALTIGLIKEGVQQVVGFSSRELNYGVATITYIMEVKKGEKVWFKKHGETLKIYGNYWSVYGGVLLHAS